MNLLLLKPNPHPQYSFASSTTRSFYANIEEMTNREYFCCKSSVNGVLLSTEIVESYRSVVKVLQENKADFHTYQFKQDKAHRMVVRNLHHTAPIKVIENE